MDKYEDIDLDIEKLVFLCNAEEGNPGIYELIWELGYYDLTIEDKYKIAHELLTSLLKDGLIALDIYTDSTLENKIETISFSRSEEILNNPCSWYPCDKMMCISLTVKGNKLLVDNASRFDNRFIDRLKGRR